MIEACFSLLISFKLLVFSVFASYYLIHRISFEQLHYQTMLCLGSELSPRHCKNRLKNQLTIISDRSHISFQYKKTQSLESTKVSLDIQWILKPCIFKQLSIVLPKDLCKITLSDSAWIRHRYEKL